VLDAAYTQKASAFSGIQSIMKLLKIHRILKLLITLQSGQRYTVDDLAKMFSVTRRTVFRDMKLLQNINVPYFYDHKNGCYEIEPDFFLSCPNLSGQEAAALLLLAKAAKSLKFPFRSSALQAVIKIMSRLPENVRRYGTAAIRNITIEETFHHVKNPLLDRLFLHILNAITNRRTLEMSYYIPDERKCKIIQLAPYHLRYSGDMWYVIGKSEVDNVIGTFDFNRIRDVKPQDRYFFLEEEFDVDKYLGKAWSITPEGGFYNVKLKFAPEIANVVAATQWHRTQKTTYQSDGSVIIELYVDGLSEIKWWVLSYGDKVRVLEPKVLRETVATIAEKMVKLNQ
jgi:predicted DNA-binding transcriptional regulator YafY